MHTIGLDKKTFSECNWILEHSIVYMILLVTGPSFTISGFETITAENMILKPNEAQCKQ